MSCCRHRSPTAWNTSCPISKRCSSAAADIGLSRKGRRRPIGRCSIGSGAASQRDARAAFCHCRVGMSEPDDDSFSYAEPDDPRLKRFVIKLIERMSGQPYLKWLYEDHLANP